MELAKKQIKTDYFSIGCSSAASWAWGTSLIMGQQIAQEKGLVSWLIWAICNSLTLAMFGFLSNKGYIKKEIYERKEVKIVALIIQMFCLLVQLNFINQQFLILVGDPILSYVITVGIGFFFTLIVVRKGLPTSIKTDVFQWLIAIGAILAIIGVGIFTEVPFKEFAPTTTSGVAWGIWSGLILFAGPIGDVQHWQRTEADTSKRGYYLGAFLFALYMMLILGMALFEFSPIMYVILLGAVLCVTTSTIDSIAVALHKLGNKRIGTSVALLMCMFWGVFVNMGMIDLWSSFGVIRFAFAISILILPFCLEGKKAPVITVGLITLFVIGLVIDMGLYSIGNIFGITCLLIALSILVNDFRLVFKNGAENK